MGIELGAADVEFSDGHGERFAAVEILGDGVLKTTRCADFAHPEYGDGVAETQVRYHSPASWQWAQPEAISSGTLWVSDIPKDKASPTWRQLAVCVSREGAYDAIARYLTEHYHRHYPDQDTQRARGDFNLTAQRRPVDAVVKNEHGELRLLAFRWAEVPEESVQNGSMLAFT